jgi:hypothetical protein
VGIRQLVVSRRRQMPCFACGHPYNRHRRQKGTNLVNQVLKCRYCDCFVRIPLPLDGRLEVEGRVTTSGVPVVDINASLSSSSPLIAQSRNAPNDAADPALYLRIDTNSNALHGGIGKECFLCSQTIRRGMAVRKRYDGTYCHDVCPHQMDHPDSP